MQFPTLFPKRKTIHDHKLRSYTIDALEQLDVLPSPTLDTQKNSGVGFNIALMVEENAPVRVREIDRDVASMQEKIATLLSEKVVLERLMRALGE